MTEDINIHDQMYDAKTFDEFWSYYQDIHASRSVRLAHALGTTSAIGLVAAAIARRSLKLAILAPMIDYQISQMSHRREGIKTKPYKKPLRHARAELRLWKSTIKSVLEGRGGRRDPIEDEPPAPPVTPVPPPSPEPAAE